MEDRMIPGFPMTVCYSGLFATTERHGGGKSQKPNAGLGLDAIQILQHRAANRRAVPHLQSFLCRVRLRR